MQADSNPTTPRNALDDVPRFNRSVQLLSGIIECGQYHVRSGGIVIPFGYVASCNQQVNGVLHITKHDLVGKQGVTSVAIFLCPDNYISLQGKLDPETNTLIFSACHLIPSPPRGEVSSSEIPQAVSDLCSHKVFYFNLNDLSMRVEGRLEDQTEAFYLDQDRGKLVLDGLLDLLLARGGSRVWNGTGFKEGPAGLPLGESDDLTTDVLRISESSGLFDLVDYPEGCIACECLVYASLKEMAVEYDVVQKEGIDEDSRVEKFVSSLLYQASTRERYGTIMGMVDRVPHAKPGSGVCLAVLPEGIRWEPVEGSLEAEAYDLGDGVAQTTLSAESQKRATVRTIDQTLNSFETNKRKQESRRPAIHRCCSRARETRGKYHDMECITLGSDTDLEESIEKCRDWYIS